MQAEALCQLVQSVLDDRKALNISVIDVRGKSNITDFMIVATATSTRHAHSLCEHVMQTLKQRGETPLGLEGELGSDWVLLDMGDVVAHVMTGHAREYYQLEKLWSVPSAGASEL
jgi:ribosome-associated protein